MKNQSSSIPGYADDFLFGVQSGSYGRELAVIKSFKAFIEEDLELDITSGIDNLSFQMPLGFLYSGSSGILPIEQ
jgi:hypothetical protein